MLELACGDGLNLLAVAAAHPRVRTVGIDLSAVAIARGRSLAEAGGLPTELLAGDLLTAGDELQRRGPFDVVVANGLLSWVPRDVAEAAIATAASVLAPDGVVFLSWASLPGSAVRGVLRRAMALLDVGGRPAERVAAARRAAALVAGSRSLAAREAGEVADLEDGHVFHDHLSPHFRAHWLHEVSGVAADHGLRYLGDTSSLSTSTNLLGEEAAAAHAALAEADPVAAQELLDILLNRHHARALFVRADAPVDPRPFPDRLADLHVSGSVTVTAADGASRTFRAGDLELTVENPVTVAALTELAEDPRRRVRVRELAARAGDLDVVAEVVRALEALQGVALHVGPTPHPLAPGDRPTASPLVRAQLARGDRALVSLGHDVVEVDDAAAALLARCDGTQPVADVGSEAALVELARLGLLVA